MKCELCHQEFARLTIHLKKIHNIRDFKLYYDQYIRQINEGICLTCGKETKFNSLYRGYSKYCCGTCVIKSHDFLKKREITYLNNYGVKNPNQCQSIKEKKKKTCLKHFGVENPSQSKEIQEKYKCTCLNRFGYESHNQNDEIKKKVRDTKINRYLNTDIIQEKYKRTCLKRYGVDNYSKRNQFSIKYNDTLTKSGGRYKLRIHALKRIENQKLNNEPFVPRIGDMERSVIDQLQISTIYKIYRNYFLIGYFVDGFIENLKLAIEFDEDYHFTINGSYSNRDIIRQKEIELLGCIFFRITLKEWRENSVCVIQKFREKVAELESKKETSSAIIN